jgi:hypothetical protein
MGATLAEAHEILCGRSADDRVLVMNPSWGTKKPSALDGERFTEGPVKCSICRDFPESG